MAEAPPRYTALREAFERAVTAVTDGRSSSNAVERAVGPLNLPAEHTQYLAACHAAARPRPSRLPSRPSGTRDATRPPDRAGGRPRSAARRPRSPGLSPRAAAASGAPRSRVCAVAPQVMPQVKANALAEMETVCGEAAVRGPGASRDGAREGGD